MAPALIIFFLILAGVAVLEYFQVSRARWQREEFIRIHREMRDMRAAFVALAREVRVDLGQMAAGYHPPVPPRRQRMPLVDRRAYWRDEQDEGQTFPESWKGRQRGQGLVEYALIIAFVVIVVVGGLVLLGPPINAAFQMISQNL
jgi:pilus assembly protein Flp/PilA